MAEDITTRPMLEALLEGQRQIASQLAGLVAKQEELAAKQEAFSVKQQELAANQAAFAARLDEYGAKLDELGAKHDRLAAKQDTLETRLVELTREVRHGFDDCNRKIEALNKRLLSFETWLSRIDDRLHDEIVARTR